MPHAFHIPAQLGELLADNALTLEDLARACRRDPQWVSERIEAGVIEPEQTGQDHGGIALWRFTSTTLVRARRIAQLEATFDADPHLAALTADLMEEVAQLRHQLACLKDRRTSADEDQRQASLG